MVNFQLDIRFILLTLTAFSLIFTIVLIPQFPPDASQVSAVQYALFASNKYECHQEDRNYSDCIEIGKVQHSMGMGIFGFSVYYSNECIRYKTRIEKIMVCEGEAQPIAVDWYLCHFSKYMGAITKCEQAPSPLILKPITLSSENLDMNGCKSLRHFGAYNIWKCEISQS